MTMLSTLMLALCCSVEAFAPARMARPAAAVRAAPMRTAPVMQFGKKKLTPEEVRPRGSARVGHGSWRPPCPARQRCCGLLLRLLTPCPCHPSQKLEAMGYWPGEWLCADCGYIYEPGTSPAFEELRPGWKCPQCAGPRRRFVKKAGDMRARTSKKCRL